MVVFCRLSICVKGIVPLNLPDDAHGTEKPLFGFKGHARAARDHVKALGERNGIGIGGDSGGIFV